MNQIVPVEIDKNELLKLLKNHLSISVSADRDWGDFYPDDSKEFITLNNILTENRKERFLEILKNRLSISIQEEEIPPYYEQNGYVELRVSLSWKMNEKQVEIASDMTRIYLEK